MVRRLGWQEVFSVRGINASKLDMFKCTPQHFHADLLQRVFDFEQFDAALSIVRHPFDRLKSEYYWQRKQGDMTRTPHDWWSHTIKAFSQDPFIYDNHIRPQHEFLIGSRKLEIFKLEEGGLRSAVAHLPGTSLVERAKMSIQKLDIREKSSAYEERIETEFSEFRSEIESFYKEDMDKLGYREKS